MAFVVQFEGILLDDKEGSFVAENGREVNYHNARFYDQNDGQIYKVKVPEGTELPEPATPHFVTLNIDLTERYCSARYVGFE